MSLYLKTNKIDLGDPEMPELIAALDIGTTGARTIIFDSSGKMLGSAYQEYPIITPKPGYVEQDATQWWSMVCATTKKVLRENKKKFV